MAPEILRNDFYNSRVDCWYDFSFPSLQALPSFSPLTFLRAAAVVVYNMVGGTFLPGGDELSTFLSFLVLTAVPTSVSFQRLIFCKVTLKRSYKIQAVLSRKAAGTHPKLNP
jgi:hypothetical protein